MLAVRLVGREVTVILNGIRVINRQSIDGPTAIALDTNEAEPGPILLQGDRGTGGVPQDRGLSARQETLSEQKASAKLYRVRGRVQGVGFRYFVEQSAKALGVRGWVRNVDDGSVEVYAVGTAGAAIRTGRVCCGKDRAGPKFAEWRKRKRQLEEHSGFSVQAIDDSRQAGGRRLWRNRSARNPRLRGGSR